MTLDDLPAELSTYIFSLVCQPTNFHEEVKDYTCPLLLGAVCESWRHLAWSTHELWRYIYITPAKYRSITQAEILEEWLRRTGIGPLDVVFRMTDERPDDSALILFDDVAYSNDPYADSLLAIIAQECERWRNIEIDIASAQSALQLDSTRDHVPLLQKLRIRTLTPQDSFYQFFQESSMLTHLSFNPYLGTTFATPNRDTCTKLVSICLENMNIGEIVPLLLGCSQTLRHIHLESIRLDRTLQQLRATDFPHLETLVVRLSYTGIIGELSGVFMAMPKFRKLAISFDHPHATRELRVIKQFLQEHDVALQTLVLRMHDEQVESSHTEERVEYLMMIVQAHSRTLQEFALEIPNLADRVYPFLEFFHQAWIVREELLGRDWLPSLNSVQFRVYWATPYWVDPEHEATPILPVLRVVKSWCRSHRVDVLAPPTRSNLKVGLPDLERDSVMEVLGTEVDEGLQVDFLGPYLGAQPPAVGCSTMQWHLQG